MNKIERAIPDEDFDHQYRPVTDGDIRIVNLPVMVVVQEGDDIPGDYDVEGGMPLDLAPGFVLRVLTGQSFLYTGQETQYFASTFKTTNQSNESR